MAELQRRIVNTERLAPGMLMWAAVDDEPVLVVITAIDGQLVTMEPVPSGTVEPPPIPEWDVILGTANCLICGTKQPSAHIPVWRPEGRPIGRVCSSHSFWDAVRLGLFVRIEAGE